MKRVVCIVLSLFLITAFCTATAECDKHCHHMCHHECGYCHADLLNEDPANLTGEETAIVAKMYSQPCTGPNAAKYLGICLYDTDVFYQPNGTKVGMIHERDDVYVVETGKYWYKIIFEDEFTGYVRPASVELYDVNIPCSGQLYKVTSTGGNRHALVRECPCGDSEIVARLDRGDYVRIDEFYNNHWALVTYNAAGCQGYIRTDLLTISYRFRQ